MLHAKTIFVSVILVLLLITLVLSPHCSVYGKENEFVLNSTDKFEIPALNSTIRFSRNGTYSQAKFDVNAWTFENLLLNETQSTTRLNLKVSCKDSNITITSYRLYNSTFSGSPAITLRLSYNATGEGSQSFNFYLKSEKGDYSVIADGIFLGLFDGWSVSPDSTITVAGGRHTVRVMFYGVPNSDKVFASQPFYQQHSVIIATAVILAVTVSLAVLIRVSNVKRAKTIKLMEESKLKQMAEKRRLEKKDVA